MICSKNWHFLTPPPPTSADVIYEWSLKNMRIKAMSKIQKSMSNVKSLQKFDLSVTNFCQTELQQSQ